MSVRDIQSTLVNRQPVLPLHADHLVGEPAPVPLGPPLASVPVMLLRLDLVGRHGQVVEVLGEGPALVIEEPALVRLGRIDQVVDGEPGRAAIGRDEDPAARVRRVDDRALPHGSAAAGRRSPDRAPGSRCRTPTGRSRPGTAPRSREPPPDLHRRGAIRAAARVPRALRPGPPRPEHQGQSPATPHAAAARRAAEHLPNPIKTTSPGNTAEPAETEGRGAAGGGDEPRSTPPGKPSPSYTRWAAAQVEPLPEPRPISNFDRNRVAGAHPTARSQSRRVARLRAPPQD